MEPTYVSRTLRLSVRAARTAGLPALWAALTILPSASLAVRANAATLPPHAASLQRIAAADTRRTPPESQRRLAHNHDWPKTYERERTEPEDESDLERTHESELDVDRPGDDREDLDRRSEDQFDLNRGSEADLDLNRPGNDSENDLNR